MRFLRANGRHKRHGLKMTPMIDVVFLLLIFFIVATRFRVPEGRLDAFAADRWPGPPVAEIRITLRVSQAGKSDPAAAPSVLIDGRPVGGRGEAVLRRLAADSGIRENVPVIIEAEPHLAYRWVIATLNLCRKMRFEKVNFAASKRNAPPPKTTSPPG